MNLQGQGCAVLEGEGQLDLQVADGPEKRNPTSPWSAAATVSGPATGPARPAGRLERKGRPTQSVLGDCVGDAEMAELTVQQKQANVDVPNAGLSASSPGR